MCHFSDVTADSTSGRIRMKLLVEGIKIIISGLQPEYGRCSGDLGPAQMKCCLRHGVARASRAHAGVHRGLLTETERSLCCGAPCPGGLKRASAVRGLSFH